MSTLQIGSRPRAASTSPTRRSTPRRSDSSRWLILGVMTISVVYFLAPVWWLLVSSTKSDSGLFSGNGFWFNGFHLWSNIRSVFAQDNGIYARWLLNTLVYAGLGAALSTLFASLAGYALAKFPFRGSGALFNIVLAAVLVPQPLLAIPLYLLFSPVHLVNTYWAVLIPSMVSPFGVYLARIYAAASVPDEVLEAARLDGSGEVRTFFQISLRVMSPALVTIFLFQFVSIWSNYLLPALMLANESLQPVTVGIVGWQQQHGSGNAVPTNVVITAAALCVVPLVILFLSLQRFWRSGMTSGSVK
ncbi:carbohydrate ABC transporter permease [Actinospica sp. MGRD01-02]|uniref:Carbohydrate ABC transporter permease n=1 Tax=Actinospica acidithermotolerans TaxID=2828514 RepID=A0A941E9R7_9ACTN|nr:carbohydrate ABC transporter permease [Actinospica acidithermotolerans]MBR7825144.1 carbohydrate ABC transporter permease [Actinospica acidithermotolerans]